ncbi:MAG TPA: xanthine dehydrogenase family protein subunit M [Burkholderiales bacterium]|nr:xanthine dehydrogenase family protein subunit M [Burkholderiales bacterium]
MYFRPARLKEAFEALASRPLTVLAGGTDHYPARVGRSPPEDILDLTGVGELRGIRKSAQGWRIGATTTWTDVIEARLPPVFDALKLAAREVGGVQIQNAGTVAGNLCNASPAADGVPALLALDASVELSRASGSRVLPLDAFLLGPRKTALEPGELVTAVHVPAPRAAAHSHFAKLGARRYLVISIAMVAAVVETERNIVQAARVAVGACSPVAVRLPALEADLCGIKLDKLLGERAEQRHLAPLTPIDDVRADAGYRREAALTLVRRTLNELGSRG